MEITINNEKIILQKKDRKIGAEAPAIKIKMLNKEEMIIGMMAPKVQTIITLPYKDSLSDEMEDLINKYNDKSSIYIISSEILPNDIDNKTSSIDFRNISLKLGVYVDDKVCAKSIFIINKDGEFVYKQIVPDLFTEFDLLEFDNALNDAINYKKKGHTHENWMGV